VGKYRCELNDHAFPIRGAGQGSLRGRAFDLPGHALAQGLTDRSQGLYPLILRHQPRTAFQIPEETQRVARAAFPRSTLCLRIADALGPVYEDESFADLFPRRGQPAQAPGRLAWVTVLQFVENLSDRAAADAVRGRLDWKYLLGLELTDPGFDHTVFSEFRSRLVGGQTEQQ
jgi:transposase